MSDFEMPKDASDWMKGYGEAAQNFRDLASMKDYVIRMCLDVDAWIMVKADMSHTDAFLSDIRPYSLDPEGRRQVVCDMLIGRLFDKAILEAMKAFNIEPGQIYAPIPRWGDFLKHCRITEDQWKRDGRELFTADLMMMLAVRATFLNAMLPVMAERDAAPEWAPGAAAEWGKHSKEERCVALLDYVCGSFHLIPVSETTPTHSLLPQYTAFLFLGAREMRFTPSAHTVKMAVKNAAEQAKATPVTQPKPGEKGYVN